MNGYVLVEKDGIDRTVLGVFSSPILPDGVLRSYYGDFTANDYQDIRDSGVEWDVLITHPTGQVILTMLEFTIDEI